jgi:arylsulfatase A-like enzyme
MLTLSAANARPNVVLIYVDDLNDYVGVLRGHPQAQTPNINRLANQGTLFTNAHVPAPSCRASRVSMLTGITPARSGVLSNESATLRTRLPKAVSLVRAFRNAGYYTAGYGKIFHTPKPELASWNQFRSGITTSPTGAGMINPRLNGLNLAGAFDWGRLAIAPSEMDDAKNTTRAIEVINRFSANNTQPFFLALGLYRPHLPWYCPKTYFQRIAGGNPQNIVLPPMRGGDLNDVGRIARNWANSPNDNTQIQNAGLQKQAIHAYLACGAFVDDQVGRIMNALDASPLRNNTIVVLVSDHGWHLGEKATWRKFKLWEESTRVPMIIRLPAGVVSNPRDEVAAPVNVAGLYPTLLEFARIPLPNYPAGDPLYRIDYTSLAPLMSRDITVRAEGRAVSFNRQGNVSIRTPGYRYTLYSDGFEELYNHAKDPNEWTNIAASGGLPQLRTSFRAEARAYLNGNHAPIGPPAATGGGGGRIGDFVWSDLDGDGIQDPAEPGYAGATVRLLNCNTGTQVATTTSAADGTYWFNNVAPGRYQLQFLPPGGTELSPRERGSSRALDSNPDPATGLTTCESMTDGLTRPGIDAGIITQAPPEGTGRIGDFVWSDRDGDGIQDPAEPGYENVTVRLLSCAGGSLLATTTSDASGAYWFNNLIPGSYQLEFVPPAGTSLSPAERGGSRALDSNPNPSTGLTTCQPMTEGSVRPGIDAGIVDLAPPEGTARIGDFIWSDLDGDGIQDPGEPGYTNVVVRLLTCDGAELDTTESSPGGAYWFNNLQAGSYQIQVVPPEGTALSPAGRGASRGLDSNPNPATGLSACLPMEDGRIRAGIDAGIVQQSQPPGSGRIGDYVWSDLDADGIQDPSEPGFDNVTVRLINCSTGALLDTTQSSAGGTYWFNNVVPGSYRLRFVPPAGTRLSPAGRGTRRDLDSNPNPSTGLTTCLTMSDGRVRPGVDAGIIRQ